LTKSVVPGPNPQTVEYGSSSLQPGCDIFHIVLKTSKAL
jgi:hypothetical protein